MQHPTSDDIQRVREFLLDLQARICSRLEQQEQLGEEVRRLSLMIGSVQKVAVADLGCCKMVT